MSASYQARSVIRNLTERSWRDLYVRAELVTNISRNWAGGERRGKIRATSPGTANHFAVTPTTWKPRNLPMEWRDYRKWLTAMVRRQSCAPKQCGGSVI